MAQGLDIRLGCLRPRDQLRGVAGTTARRRRRSSAPPEHEDRNANRRRIYAIISNHRRRAMRPYRPHNSLVVAQAFQPASALAGWKACATTRYFDTVTLANDGMPLGEGTKPETFLLYT